MKRSPSAVISSVCVSFGLSPAWKNSSALSISHIVLPLYCELTPSKLYVPHPRFRREDRGNLMIDRTYNVVQPASPFTGPVDGDRLTFEVYGRGGTIAAGLVVRCGGGG